MTTRSDQIRILSSYPLADRLNRRIADVLDDRGSFVPSGADEDRQEIIDRIEREIAATTIYLGGRLTQEQFDRADRLRWIHVPWAGVNTLLTLDLAGRDDLLLSNSRGVMADAVADQTLAYLIMLNRSLPQQIGWQQQREWHRYQSVEHPDRRILRGRTLGILGYGAIGRAIGHRARACGMEIIGLRRNPKSDAEGEGREEGVEIVGPESRDELFDRSDFLVVALPLTDETRGSIGRREFGRMKPDAYIINIARGAIIRTDDLQEALLAGEIAGGALDVVEPEPLPSDSLLWTIPNLIITPHSSAGFTGFATAVTDLFVENLQRYLRGDGLLNRVDPARGY